MPVTWRFITYTTQVHGTELAHPAFRQLGPLIASRHRHCKPLLG